jgi:hypothetical protein
MDALLGCLLPALLTVSPLEEPVTQRYPLVFEPRLVSDAPPLGADAAAQNFGSVDRLLSRGLDALIHPLGPPERWQHVLARVGRFALVDFPVINYLKAFDHEAFGHGWRCRDVGLRPCEWVVAVPPPYQFGGESFAITPAAPTVEREILIRFGGHEADELVSAELLRQSLAGARWEHLASLHHLTNQLLPGLLSGTWGGPLSDVGTVVSLWEVRRAQMGLAAWSGAPAVTRALVTASVLADPLVWYSLYDYFWAWLVRGRAAGPLPDLFPGPLAGTLRPIIHLLPWGPELGASAVTLLEGRLYEAGFTVGPGMATVTGSVWADAHVPTPHPSLSARVRASGWLQEGELPFVSSTPDRRPEIRAGVGVEGDLSFAVAAWLAPRIRFGMKTPGFWAGRPFDAAVYLQAGLEVRLTP